MEWKDGMGDLSLMPTEDLLKLKDICNDACNKGLDLMEPGSGYIPKYRFIALDAVEEEIRQRSE